MSAPPIPDTADWRTWQRTGDWLIPPPGSTAAERVAACCAFSAARFGAGGDRQAQQSVMRVMRQADGVAEQVRFTRRGECADVAVRVYGGCRR